MPKRTDIRKILLLGSGPIVIGQACEFDYSGTQAARSLRDEGYEVVLVNSNPATIMTDPDVADRTYIEPLTVSALAKIIERERPDALLPTVGGQTALNLAVKLAETGILRESGTRLIGARLETIRVAEDRRLFRAAMVAEGLDVPRSIVVSSVEGAVAQVAELGYPVVIRPSFTLGGEGGGLAYNLEELREVVGRGIEASPVGEVLVEEGIVGWKEFELEVMRDCRDRFVVVCTIENIDPMGVHTGDSITVAPAMTLSDVELQTMRDMAKRVIRRVGVETGGSNIQFGVHPETGRIVVIEMNPRVSRSSALASKATGFPIAKIAAKLAVGMTLDEIRNDITRETPASFEPSLDYVVVKIPRFAFKKFPGTSDTLDTQMRSVGEVMSIGRTFNQALQKAVRSLEVGRAGLGADGKDSADIERLREHLVRPHPARLFWVRAALANGIPLEEVHETTRIDRWFLHQIADLIAVERELRTAAAEPAGLAGWGVDLVLEAKRQGFSDRQLAYLANLDEPAVRAHRRSLGVEVAFKSIDTCAAEFRAATPYFYSSYDEEDEATTQGDEQPKVVILGGGPNRIGQGIEFDCCCVHAVMALREVGYQTVMVNCNPETVSTDYDISDRLYFEPLTAEDVLAIVERERPIGVIAQFGGATPLGLAGPLSAAGVRILGTSYDTIDMAEDRGRFGQLLDRLGIRRPDYGTASSLEEARAVAESLGYPVLVRPSYVLGGQAMAVCYDNSRLAEFIDVATRVGEGRPVLIDRFLEDAFEVDVDAICDGEQTVICGIMEHLEEAGIHSGDSTAVLPTLMIGQAHLDEIRECTKRLALELGVKGLLNVQYAIADGELYVLEANPRASRTIPFLSKALGVPFAKIAAKVMVGHKLKDLGLTEEPRPERFSVKVPVFPFDRFPGFDPVLGPEMRSTGEAYGCDDDFGLAFAKGMIAAGQALPVHGNVFISVNDRDKEKVVPIARDLAELGFTLVATRGNAKQLQLEGLTVKTVFKVNEGRPNIVDRIRNREIDLVINTPLGGPSYYDEHALRRAALSCRIPLVSTLSAARAAVQGIRRLRDNVLTVRALQGGPAGTTGTYPSVG
ncbi:MAG: carbamoyl-phosphate synthase large subunit [Proteobacteria bacterium]|nr:carbamoyl-phosphate synthase large subunit [Pseudomonadota bacterium]